MRPRIVCCDCNPSPLATAKRLVSGLVKLLAAAIAIQAHRPQHAQSGELHAEKGVNIDQNEAVARVAFCTIFKLKTIIRAKQFTVYMVSYPEESAMPMSDTRVSNVLKSTTLSPYPNT